MIDKGTSDRKNVQHSASLAHLMGMDILPSERKSMVDERKFKYENSRKHLPRKEPPESSVSHCRSLSRRLLRQTKEQLLLVDNKQKSSLLSKSRSLPKSLCREHAQEELPNFKKEFEGCQASKLRDRPRNLEQKDSLWEGGNNQVRAQEYLNKEKMTRYRKSAHKKYNELKGYVSTAKLEPNKQQRGLGHERPINNQWQSSLRKDVTASRNREKTNKFEHLPVARRNERNEYSYPTMIDLMEPSTERVVIEEPQVDSSKIIEKGISMEDFLKEVKERLRLEMEGKGRKTSASRRFRIQTSLSERSSDPKQIARDIANHIRKSVSRDLGTMLTKSKSSSKVQLTEPDSPAFIRRSTRKFLSEKLENVLRIQTEAVTPLINYGRSGSSLLAKGKLRIKSKSEQNMDDSEDKKPLSESICKPLSREQENNLALDADAETVSPRDLLRSFSYPLSGTAFVKLFLEDQHVLTGSQIYTELEASEETSTRESKNKIACFNLKGRVSHLRQNFTLKGKLFSKKIQSVEESADTEFDSMKTILTSHADVLDLGTAQDNSSEVPPSPTSVSSSSQEEFCRPGELSHVSTLEVHSIEDHPSPQVYGESNINLSDLSLPELMENVGPEQVSIEGQSYDDEIVQVEGHMESYLREILVNSGLYGGISSDQVISRWDAPKDHIPQFVFETVEEACNKYLKVHDETNIGQRMLFDLANEALPSVLGTPFTSSKLKSWVVGQTRVPHGRKLLDDLWHHIQRYTHARVEESDSVDRTVARNVNMNPWYSMLHEGVDVAEREMEWVILGELIDEFVYDMLV